MASVAVQKLPCNIMDARPGPIMLAGGFTAGVASYSPQDHLQQLQRHTQLHPPVQGFISHPQVRVAEKRKRHWSKKRKQQSGSQPNHPSQLAALAVKNRQRTKRHYPQGQETPRTVPRAPFHSTSDLINARQNDDGANLASAAGAEQDAGENLDFLGSNDYLLMHDASASDDASGSSDSEMDPAEGGAEEQVNAALKPRQDQISYIMSLEQENMALRQQNEDLQKQLLTLKEQLRNGVEEDGQSLSDDNEKEEETAGAGDPQ